MRRIVIEGEGGSQAPAGDPSSSVDPLDEQDFLLVAGILFWEIAAAVIWWPAALILAGVFCFAFVYMIQRTKGKGGAVKP